MKKRLLMIVLCALFLPGRGMADEIRLVVGRSLPPYVIVDEWRGLEYDIVREVLAVEGHTIRPHFTTYARVVKEMEGGQSDAAMTMRQDSGVNACYSNSHISYQNYAITLAKNNINVKSIDDLRNYSVISFQNASLYLGDAYRAAVGANANYREEAQQALQPVMLFSDRVQVVVADRNIFAWFADQPDVKARVSTDQSLRLHPIFPQTDYHVAFRRREMCDSFNRGLKKIRENGLYDKIVARYRAYLKVE